MKSPLNKSIGEVVTDYGTKVMRILKKRLQRSLFDFYGDVKADNLRTRESVNVPTTPVDGDGGVIYTKSSDGKLYYKSNEVSEVELSSSGATLTTEQVQDIVGAMFSGNTETNITATYEDSDGTIDLVSTDTNTQLTTEEVQDIVGAMFTSNTETRISATYEDSDGTIDLVVDAIPVDLTVDGAGTIHANNVPTLNQSTTGNAATSTLATNSQGITSATDADVTITSDGEVTVKLDSDNDETNQSFKITNNVDAVLFSVGEDGKIFTAAGTITNTGSDTDLEIQSDGNITFTLDRDNDETGQSFSFKNFNVEIANLDESGNLQIDGDLTVSGNDIKDNDGTTCITFDSSGNTTIAGTTSGTFSGNLTGNASGSSGSCTGNAATATSLTTGDKAITGTLTVTDGSENIVLNSTSSNGNPLLTFKQDSTRRAFIQLADNNAGFENHMRIASEYGPVSMAAASTAGSDTDTVYLMVEPTGVFKFGAADADAVLTTDGNMTFRIDSDNDETGQKFSFENNASTEVGSLDESGNLNVNGIITGKQREIYSQSFVDDLGTTKHYIPWKDINEQTTIYQEEASMLMPCDGRIVSVTIRTASITGSGNMTIGVNTIAPNINQFSSSNWTEEETETLALASTDDYHVFHFAFDNAKHFDSGDLVTISIQNDADLSSNTFWYVSTVVEYDWSTFLGTTSAEHDSNP